MGWLFGFSCFIRLVGGLVSCLLLSGGFCCGSCCLLGCGALIVVCLAMVVCVVWFGLVYLDCCAGGFVLDV